MSKRNIAYIKPQDPKFLAQLKQQIGYKEGPSVDTKRQKLEDLDNSSSDCDERPEREDERPQVVVLRSGDLTAEEAANEEQRLAKEAAEAPADLSQPIVFRKRAKANPDADKVPSSSSDASSVLPKKKDKSKKKSSKSSHTSKLSFDVEQEEED